MPYYSVMLRGYNFPGHPIGKPMQRFGFFTTRWVQALNEKAAELKAVEAVWDDPELAIPPAAHDEDRAYLRLEEIKQVKSLPRMRGGGATWFEEEDQ